MHKDYILNNLQVRRSSKQKQEFFDYVKKISEEKGYPVYLETLGMVIKNKNIIVGDIYKAKYVFGAHYDTCAWMPFPNFLTPLSLFWYIVYQLFLLILIVLINSLFAVILTFIIKDAGLIQKLSSIFFWAFIIQMLAGFSNKHTVNDNTSGIITLLELISSIPEDKKDEVCFVFFDNEEIGLLGSSAFKNNYKNIMQNKLLINFDCVSDGDNLLLVSKKKFFEENKSLSKSFELNLEKYNKNLLYYDNKKAFYPSDNLNFENGIGVAALKKNYLFGYYLNRIHTSKDTIFDDSNIEYIKESIIDFISKN